MEERKSLSRACLPSVLHLFQILKFKVLVLKVNSLVILFSPADFLDLTAAWSLNICLHLICFALLTPSL